MRFEALDLALDTAKQKIEEDMETKMKLTDLEHLRTEIDLKLETLDLALDKAKEIAEEEFCKI